MKGRGITLTAIFAALLFTFSAMSLEVDVDEIKKGKKVRFQNYRGKIRKFDSAYTIRFIGRRLGKKARKGRYNVPYRYHMKYSIVVAVSKKEPKKLSADIFSIDKYARVGNIKNVQRILEGYYMSRYGYNWREARTLAVFTTYYNAVYRGNLKYFNSVYKTVVTRKLKKWNAGISTKYWEWPGRSKIVIPLTKLDKRGKIRKIDPFIISDKKVRKEVRKDKKNIDDRKDIVRIKDKIIKKEEKKVEKDRKKVEEKKKIIEKKKDDIKKKEDDVKKIKDPKKRKEEEKKIEKEKKKIKKEEDKVKKEEDKVKKKEDDIKKKKDDVIEEKKEIKKDENKKTDDTTTSTDLKKKEDDLKKKEDDLDKREDKIKKKESDKNVFANKLFYLKVKKYLQDGHYNNEMYMINMTTGKIDFKSSVGSICGRRYDVYSEGVVVIAHKGKGDHNSSHHLTMLDRKTLNLKVQGGTDIFWRSFIEIRDGFIYAIMLDEGKYYLGRFDKDLKLVKKSLATIDKNTFISIYGDKIFITGADKKILVLKKDDMTLLKTIKPE